MPVWRREPFRRHRAALAEVKDSAKHPEFDGLESVDKLPIAMVAINVDHTRPFVGQHANEMFYSGSLMKVAAMYAAFQLRFSVNTFLATLDPHKFADEDAVFAAVQKAFDSKILSVSELIKKSGSTGHRPPQYKRIFTASLVSGKWQVVFRADVDPLSNFDHHLDNMVVNSHTASAGICIQALGFSWIDGLLEKAGLFNPKSHRGIWLAGDYLGSQAIIKAAHERALHGGRVDSDFEEEFALGISGWREVRVHSENDGPSKQAATCSDLARLFVLLCDSNLVPDAASDTRHPSEDMMDMLKRAVSGNDAPSTVNRFPSAPPPFTVIGSKIGVGTLGTTGNCILDAHGHTQLRKFRGYVCATKRPTAP
jgi:hypothetical protein